MVACIEPDQGLFFRINSKGTWQTPVKLEKQDHDFLERDSFLECGEPLELDEYLIDESIADRGIIGAVSATKVQEIYQAVLGASSLSQADKEEIRKALGC